MLARVILPGYALPTWERAAGRCARWRGPRPRMGADVRGYAVIVDTAECHRRALDALAAVDELAIVRERLPGLYGGAIVYAPELGEQFRYAGEVARSGWGDCDDLAAYRAAELRLAGDRSARPWPVPAVGGLTPGHVVVRTARGDEDPSRALGM